MPHGCPLPSADLSIPLTWLKSRGPLQVRQLNTKAQGAGLGCPSGPFCM